MAYFPTTRITIKDGPNLDSFNRLRSSTAQSVFGSKQLFDNQAFFWDTQVSGANSTTVYTGSLSQTGLYVGSLSGSYTIRQTFQTFDYQPGNSQLIMMTGICKNETNVIKRLGPLSSLTASVPYHPESGLFFEADGTNYKFGKFLTGSSVTVSQSQWNIDPFDGTGPSGFTLDFTKVQIWLWDYEWLGSGRVRCGFVLDGNIYYAHQFVHANVSTNVYMRTPNLPLHYEIRSFGATGSLTQICSAVLVEGTSGPRHISHEVSTKALPVSIGTAGTIQAICGIRLKKDVKGATAVVDSVSVLGATADNYRWMLAVNPVLTGTIGWVDHADSSVQRFSGSGQTITCAEDPGSLNHVLATGYGAASTVTSTLIPNDLSIGISISGSRDSVVLLVQSLTNNSSIFGSLTFRERL